MINGSIPNEHKIILYFMCLNINFKHEFQNSMKQKTGRTEKRKR